jgi:diacylglycerol kinase (ATP)
MKTWQLLLTPLIVKKMRLLRSFGFAINGFRICAKEPNFKIHIALAILAVVMGVLLHISITEWLVVSICIALLLAFEMLNTALEQICNLVCPGFNPAIKIIKDVSAAAVLIVAIMAAVCGAIIFIPKIFF